MDMSFAHSYNLQDKEVIDLKTIKIPYYTSSIDLHIDERNLEAVLYPKIHQYKVNRSEGKIVRKALANPIGTDTLANIAKGKKRVVLVTSDHTRSVPSRITLPILLNEIRSGNPDADITILIATGLHRATTEAEQRRMFGDAIVDNEKIVVHDAFKDEDMIRICELPSGADFVVNRLAVDCDLLVTEGFIEPHFFAGFSGGRKSILPGICSQETVNENHSYKAIDNINAAPGITVGNPIHEDMVYAARRVNVQFILNMALNGEKKIIAAFAGDLVKAHEKGCEFIKDLSTVPSVTGDIVITGNGGYPLDQNLYQSPKAAATAEACARKGGVIIMCASCIDGFGGVHFKGLMLSGTISEIADKLSKIPPKETIPEMWCVQIFTRIMNKHKIILVTTHLDHEMVRKANMIPASNPDQALEIAWEMKGKDARVVVIPDGVATLAIKQ